jgi:hypothetical protein
MDACHCAQHGGGIFLVAQSNGGNREWRFEWNAKSLAEFGT